MKEVDVMKPWKVLLLSVFLVGTLGLTGWASLKIRKF